ncbi:cysteine--tRNA ligase [Malacoplasma iowae]|uniref:Cysteine--tRNA ligase n=1 Tax=Malacoplasma iowae 695 TaxID=1048830 RepID=A0A6P1LCN2_MALIO|nr:cysteine--tRNA ligase [Malacoplasma iowae]QHG89947.1 cysteine--tRNA ligase [Malacoplasma iowae 695]WPL36324.1 cysteine--tRNA ligase [Malacoplasma iowae]VEU62140.1 Cysteine--tRNA ligase [Mycoplasmopsis fermentans]VEU70464.1 Cysteine--tRNA ligase [Malacoplasma iowae]
MKLYNAIKKEYVNLEIINNNISIYLCGPTVYNHVHVGNIRPIITFDVLHRLLKQKNINVNFVHNITDIDDKIIKQAAKEKVSELGLSNYYYEKYLEILKKLNIDLTIKMPKVSDHINGIINYIEQIQQKGFAYQVDGDVYFKTLNIPNYGSLSNKKTDELEVGSRVADNNKKLSPFDFVLWKQTNEGINWDTMFSKGRPGWHTECSYLISQYIGKQVDIHGGGVDLKFPHHENENAQNIAINDCELAKHWIHVGHLNIDNNKMSKSLNNFILAKDILSKYSSNDIRWFFYQTNYANPINFTNQAIDSAKQSIENILYSLNIFKSYLILENKFNMINNIDKDNLFSSLLNDLNFPNAVSDINKIVKEANTLLRQKEYDQLNIKVNELILYLDVMGITYRDDHSEENIELLKKWNEYKNNKDFEKSDLLRKELIYKKLI